LGLAACAQQNTPTGGLKDEIPPAPVSISPPLFSTYFDGNSFEIVFDEYIQSQDLSSQLIISPPLTKTPEHRVRGKKLLMSWTDTLQENTTYQFNLGKGIVDLNESNPNMDLVYVFSTGSYIDSLTVTGKVLQAIDNEPLAGAAVMLYTTDVDSLPLTQLPGYLALTNALGEFRVRYLPEGDFKLFVLAEEGPNYKYDGPPEQIGFLERTITSIPEDSARILLIPTFIERDTTQYIKSTVAKDYGYYEVVFNVPAKNPSIQFMDVETEQLITPVSVLNDRRDTLRNWVKLPPRDDLEEVEVIIREDTSFADTSFWYIEPDPKFKDKANLIVTSNATRNRLDLSQTFDLQFSHPLEEADTSLMWLLEDSIRVYPTSVEQDQLFRKMKISYPFAGEKSYLISLQAGAFQDFYGNYSDSLGFGFSLQDVDFYGNFSVDVLLNDSLLKIPVLLQLSDETGLKKEVRLTGSKKVEFGRMIPGEYGLKIIFDKNDNGKWDSGNYKEKIQPEKVSIYSEPLKIRSNWDLDIEWIPLSEFPVD